MNLSLLNNRLLTALLVTCLMSLSAASVKADNELANAGFETPDASFGDTADAGAPWDDFGAPETRFTTSTIARTDNQSLKTFGPFDFIGAGTGATQQIPAEENSPYQAEIYAQHITGDALDGGNFGVFKIEFLDANMDFVGGLGEPAGTPLVGFNVFESEPINSDTPLDTWTALDASGFSPAGTEFVRAVLVQVQLGDGQDNFTGGAIYWDDAFVMKGVPGDYDLDGDTDGTDFLVWQRGESPDGGSEFELDLWQTNYGAMTPSLAAVSVPEPTSAALIMLATALMLNGSRNRQR